MLHEPDDESRGQQQDRSTIRTSLSVYTKLILRFHQRLGVLNLRRLMDTTIGTFILADNHASSWELAAHERGDKPEITKCTRTCVTEAQ